MSDQFPGADIHLRLAAALAAHCDDLITEAPQQFTLTFYAKRADDGAVLIDDVELVP